MKSISYFFILILLLSSCSLFDFSDVNILLFPQQDYSILKENEHIYIEFSKKPVEDDIENIISLKNSLTSIDYYTKWENNRLYIYPYETYIKGYLYTLKLDGTFKTEDGLSFQKNITLPFYYVNSSTPPILLNTNLDNSVSYNVNKELVFTFSKEIDSIKFENLFSVSPNCEIQYLWSNKNKVVTIKPKDIWTNNTVYSWTIKNTISSIDGILFPKDFSGSFLIQDDIQSLNIVSIKPVIISNNQISILNTLNLEDLNNDMDLYLEFDKEIDFESLNNSIVFSPQIQGNLLQHSKNSFVYCFADNFKQNTNYRLQIKKGLLDTKGNKTIKDFCYEFSPSIKSFVIDSIVINNNTIGNIEINNIDEKTIIENEEIEYFGNSSFYINLTINLNSNNNFLDLHHTNRINFTDTFSIEAVFPFDIEQAKISRITWINDRCINITISNLTKSTKDRIVYYKFQINKGSLSSCSSNGSYLENEKYFYFEAPYEK